MSSSKTIDGTTSGGGSAEFATLLIDKQGVIAGDMKILGSLTVNGAFAKSGVSPVGPRGPRGFDGSNGTNGDRGFVGATGTNGRDGTNGTNGRDGTDGLKGDKGDQGLPGKDGLNVSGGGTQGPAGKDGTNGQDGTNGSNGQNGTNGTNGRDGTNGSNGTNGTNGAKGDTGAVGPQGPQGPPGVQQGSRSLIFYADFGSGINGIFWDGVGDNIAQELAYWDYIVFADGLQAPNRWDILTGVNDTFVLNSFTLTIPKGRYHGGAEMCAALNAVILAQFPVPANTPMVFTYTGGKFTLTRTPTQTVGLSFVGIPSGLPELLGFVHGVNYTGTSPITSPNAAPGSYVNYARNLTILGKLVQINPLVKIYGYVDLGVDPPTQNLTQAQIQTRVTQWRDFGVTGGIFFDDYGYDFGVPRSRATLAVQYAKQSSPNFGVIANAFKPDDAMGSLYVYGGNPANGTFTLVNAYGTVLVSIAPGNYTTGTSFAAAVQNALTVATATMSTPVQYAVTYDADSWIVQAGQNSLHLVTPVSVTVTTGVNDVFTFIPDLAFPNSWDLVTVAAGTYTQTTMVGAVVTAFANLIPTEVFASITFDAINDRYVFARGSANWALRFTAGQAIAPLLGFVAGHADYTDGGTGTITSANALGGFYTVTVSPGTYSTTAMATALKTALQAADSGSTWTVTYSSSTTGTWTFVRSPSLAYTFEFSLNGLCLWLGFYVGNYTASSSTVTSPVPNAGKLKVTAVSGGTLTGWAVQVLNPDGSVNGNDHGLYSARVLLGLDQAGQQFDSSTQTVVMSYGVLGSTSVLGSGLHAPGTTFNPTAAPSPITSGDFWLWESAIVNTQAYAGLAQTSHNYAVLDAYKGLTLVNATGTHTSNMTVGTSYTPEQMRVQLAGALSAATTALGGGQTYSVSYDPDFERFTYTSSTVDAAFDVKQLVNVGQYNNCYQSQFDVNFYANSAIKYVKNGVCNLWMSGQLGSNVSATAARNFWATFESFALIFGAKCYNLDAMNYSATSLDYPAQALKWSHVPWFSEFYTSNVNMLLNTANTQWDRSQSGHHVTGYMDDMLGPYYGTIQDDGRFGPVYASSVDAPTVTAESSLIMTDKNPVFNMANTNVGLGFKITGVYSASPATCANVQWGDGTGYYLRYKTNGGTEFASLDDRGNFQCHDLNVTGALNAGTVTYSTSDTYNYDTPGSSFPIVYKYAGIQYLSIAAAGVVTYSTGTSVTLWNVTVGNTLSGYSAAFSSTVTGNAIVSTGDTVAGGDYYGRRTGFGVLTNIDNKGIHIAGTTGAATFDAGVSAVQTVAGRGLTTIANGPQTYVGYDTGNDWGVINSTDPGNVNKALHIQTNGQPTVFGAGVTATTGTFSSTASFPGLGSGNFAYREGTWTPTLTDPNAVATYTYSAQSGVYTQMGRLVTFNIACTVNVATGVNTGVLQLSLPFTSSGQRSMFTVAVITGGTLNTATCMAYNDSGAAYANVRTSAGGLYTMASAIELDVSGSYYVAAL